MNKQTKPTAIVTVVLSAITLFFGNVALADQMTLPPPFQSRDTATADSVNQHFNAAKYAEGSAALSIKNSNIVGEDKGVFAENTYVYIRTGVSEINPGQTGLGAIINVKMTKIKEGI